MRARYPHLSATSKALLLASAITLCLTQPSHAALTVSSAATKHVACSGGVCSATAAKATLNVTDLQNMLAASDVSLVSGSVAGDIVVSRAVTWTSTSTLTLDAYHAITVEQPVSVEGTAGLTLTTNDGGSGGTLTFATQGYATLWDLSSRLTINGASYTLVGDIASLAEDVAATPSGHFALAKPYDASADGSYANAAIPTSFTGDFEGLGNTISNFTVDATVRNGRLALFANLESSAVVEGLAMTGVVIVSHGREAFVATIAAQSFGLVRNVRAAGKAHLTHAVFGGLVSDNLGTVADSSTAITARISDSAVGGLVAQNERSGVITNSFSTGNMGYRDGLECSVGGLADINNNIISNSYATGVVVGQFAGGLVAVNEEGGVIENSYATGLVGGDTQDYGGVVGIEDNSATLVNAYWDTTTSQTSQGCGGTSSCTGATGLTDAQFKSGLPDGFDPAIWGQSTGVNGGYPYLLGNPPKK